MLRFGKSKKANEEFCGANKKPVKFGMLMLIIQLSQKQLKKISKYLMGYLDVVRRQLLLILPKISGYVKTFKDNNKLMQVHIDDNKLLEKYKIIWTKMEDLKNIELDDLPV